MRNSRYFILLFFVAALLFSGACGKKKQYVAVVEGDSISLDEFNLRFEYYLKSKYFQQPELIPQARNSMEERKLVLKDMINEKLILKEAKKMNIDKKDEVKNLIKLYTQQIILNAYIEQYLANDIQVSDLEMNEFYAKNQDKFRNVDPEYAKRSIKYQLMMQKYDKKITEILDKLRNLYRVEEDESVIRPIYNETNVLKNLQKGMPQLPGTPAPGGMLNKNPQSAQ
ncbi:MAG: SurA N-terminal domain-containing protein [bacterium]|nr:SurA N-terminal domain-containing protein [bacterium]